MKNILLIAVLSMSAFSCEMLDAVKSVNSMPNQMNGMNANMTDMKNKMAELEMDRNLDNEDKFDYNAPISFGQLGDAKLFGEYVTQEHLLGWFFKEYETVEMTTIHDYKGNWQLCDRQKDENGNVVEVNCRYTDGAITFEKNKFRKKSLMLMVAGLLPQSKVEDLIPVVQNEQEYTDTARRILAMRYKFITELLMSNKYTSDTLRVLGEMEQAIVYLKQAEYISNLNFANSIKYSITSFTIFGDEDARNSSSIANQSGINLPNQNEEMVVDPTMIRADWEYLSEAFEKNLKIGSYAANEDQKVAQRQRMLSVKSEIDQGLARSQQYVAPVAP